MKSLLNTAAVVTAAIALGGCPNKRRQPVPGPQSAAAHTMPTSSDGRDDASRRDAGADGHRCYNPRGWACSTAVSAGDSSTRCLRAETREVDGMNSGNPSGCDPMATLSRAAGTPAEGAETT